MNLPSRESSLVFGLGTAVGASLAVLSTLTLVLLNRPFAAAIVLGCSMIALGLLRAAWNGQPWFSARGRFSDSLVYAGAGIAILWLSPWAEALTPVI